MRHPRNRTKPDIKIAAKAPASKLDSPKKNIGVIVAPVKSASIKLNARTTQLITFNRAAVRFKDFPALLTEIFPIRAALFFRNIFFFCSVKKGAAIPIYQFLSSLFHKLFS